MDRAVALAPKTVATAKLVERLRTLIASIEASLAELVGDDEGGPLPTHKDLARGFATKASVFFQRVVLANMSVSTALYP